MVLKRFLIGFGYNFLKEVRMSCPGEHCSFKSFPPKTVSFLSFLYPSVSGGNLFVMLLQPVSRPLIQARLRPIIVLLLFFLKKNKNAV